MDSSYGGAASSRPPTRHARGISLLAATLLLAALPIPSQAADCSAENFPSAQARFLCILGAVQEQTGKMADNPENDKVAANAQIEAIESGRDTSVRPPAFEVTTNAAGESPVVQAPLLASPACRDAIAKGIVGQLVATKDMDEDAARAMVRQHVRDRAALSEGDSSVKINDVLTHIVECADVCQPMVQGLTACHVDAVAAAYARHLVRFETGETRLDLTGDNKKSIDAAIAELQDNGRLRVVVIGRASNIGPTLLNHRISLSRAYRVYTALVDGGIDYDRIGMVALGLYPPQLDGSIASAYGMKDLYDSLPNETWTTSAGVEVNRAVQLMNQSVLLVVFDPGDESLQDRFAKKELI